MNKEKWIEEVLHSMDDAERARPPADLFERIERRIDEAPVCRLRVSRWQAIAAALLILLLNVLALRQAMRANTSSASSPYQARLVTELKIYD